MNEVAFRKEYAFQLALGLKHLHEKIKECRGNERYLYKAFIDWRKYIMKWIENHCQWYFRYLR